MKPIVLASGNKGKLVEFQQMFETQGIKIVAQSEYGVGDVPETGTTFVENAIIKARHAAEISGEPAIADDSGIEVDALDGQPGIYSARYGGPGAGAVDNYQKLLANMQDKSNRAARFRCVLVYMRHAKDPSPIIASASWEGSIAQGPQGGGGHGYDPIFWVNTDNCSAAELPPERKNALSHRGKALVDLLAQMKALGELPTGETS
ncbi:RdgB/HAM1 family non-canonical purine NTP pyrophosphatase [Paraferrimonas sedimenticola]|uniref:dITP/XTP pyrophosphatase n=1 Tax=Paraferrimonas sedimenticola TaxID=375674 RepID=A0AA37RYZ5_9GAMM|nr:RdgB/HAM1 family non-canonical purine NTP pyrophosphatase [Paraferrimonas sedimenticola]GLP98100.1 non-canonical purine NTP pyrophosphatase [Paraferrimonas sedimenticola]